ncbi:MAG: class I SAM-dependent methyltransferase [Neisseriaceae bacterium]|nr:class I SAM-dependent methyltransferase [Neisseriaceae bacterium]
MNDKFISLSNRIAKNYKHLRKMMHKSQIEAYRIYDRDLPEFPFAIDIYANHLHIQEYDTGWKISEQDYQEWIDNVIQAVCAASNIDIKNIHLKKRSRQRGTLQYEKQNINSADFVVMENNLRFFINLDTYLDSGLFLDHRNLRSHIKKESAGKRFLNLFAYTGSFTVYAVAGGAIYSETVDLSNTYLDWAKRNFILNNINDENHCVIRQDVFVYLQNAIAEKKKFDLIVMDPPTFSNSKKMTDILDIQRDHIKLIEQAMQLLDFDGILYFSNNLRTFVLDKSIMQKYLVTDISLKTIPNDFRNKKIHYCWKIKHR